MEIGGGESWIYREWGWPVHECEFSAPHLSQAAVGHSLAHDFHGSHVDLTLHLNMASTTVRQELEGQLRTISSSLIRSALFVFPNLACGVMAQQMTGDTCLGSL